MTNTVIDEIAAERRRQIEVEGWSAEHDDAHKAGEMAIAAAVYALISTGFERTAAAELWPKTWSELWMKPTNRRRDLIKAGALIVAEIERLDRGNSK